MDLSLFTVFDASPLDVHAVYESDAFKAQLAEISGMDKRLLDERSEGEQLIRRTHVEKREPLPGFVAKVLGTSKLTYIQTDRLDPATANSTWNVEIPALGERVSVSGSTTFVATATGCERTVKGTVRVKVPIVGKRIEKAVAGDFGKSAARAAEIAKRLLAERAV